MTISYRTTGTGDPLVLLHSGVADSRMWEPVTGELAKRFQVVAPDYRGFGRTPFQADEPYSDAGDVADLLAALGLRQARLVASSYGCEIALRLACAHPGLVTRLVLLNPGSDLPPTPDLKAFGAEEDRLIEAGLVDEAADLNVRTWLGPEADERAARELREMQRHAFTVQLAADPEPERFKPEVRLDQVHSPALVVSGAHDLPYFQQSARHLAAELPEAALVELDWAGHLPSVERPDLTLALLLDYL
ncbi:alpha/beta hydrolase [Nonomuraea sp. NPDC046570]|uniref:alpha/beta fold hydrolase n=1 Tax=Nonomuraea sp. NPDC046570 TaxID=3155255 RepID=UPI00340AF61E